MGKGQRCRLPSSGSKSMTCNESKLVNVGEPVFSQKERVSADKPKAKEAEKEYRESDAS